MKTIGLLGGMSWQSTAIYYRLINEETHRRLGGIHSASIAMVSVDFQTIEEHQRKGEWQAASKALVARALQVESAGAELLLLCTNTMHKIADDIASQIRIPFLHIADATAHKIREANLQKIGLLGTRFTMEEDFYRTRLETLGFDVHVPPVKDRETIHRIIYEELCRGIVRDPSRQEFVRIVEELASLGVQGIVEGCTEIAMLLQPQHVKLPLFDTTSIHAQRAVDFALSEG